jgi:hypothetical protein
MKQFLPNGQLEITLAFNCRVSLQTFKTTPCLFSVFVNSRHIQCFLQYCNLFRKAIRTVFHGGGSRGIQEAPRFLIPGFRPLYPRGKSPGYPLNRRLRQLESLSGRFGEEENILPLPGFELQFLCHTTHI